MYWKEGPDMPATSAGRGESAPVADQQAGRGGRGGAASGAGRGARPEFGSDLVLRNLADGAERTFADAAEFSLTDDGKQLVYAVSARDTAKNGAFAVQVGAAGDPAALLAGKGKYAKLTW